MEQLLLQREAVEQEGAGATAPTPTSELETLVSRCVGASGGPVSLFCKWWALCRLAAELCEGAPITGGAWSTHYGRASQNGWWGLQSGPQVPGVPPMGRASWSS